MHITFSHNVFELFLFFRGQRVWDSCNIPVLYFHFPEGNDEKAPMFLQLFIAHSPLEKFKKKYIFIYLFIYTTILLDLT